MQVLEFRTFFEVLQQMAADLRKQGVTHVVMEASGVHTEPVYYALAGQDFGVGKAGKATICLVLAPASVRDRSELSRTEDG